MPSMKFDSNYGTVLAPVQAYRKKHPSGVMAAKLPEDISIAISYIDSPNKIIGKTGDYLVVYPDGDITIITKDYFESNYEMI